MQKYYSNGKLLLTAEYVVLDGALSLAVPTKQGQSLTIESIDEPKIIWTSLDELGSTWFEDTFLIEQITSGFSNPNNAISERVIQILNAVKTLNPNFLNTNNGFKITTSLTFPKNWGLGTSSTLINNVAQWANVDAFELLKLTFGGSGYDIACAQNNTPITYQLQKENTVINPVNFNPTFKEHLYFVYLNKKQNSRDGIATYKANKSNLESVISEINDITTSMISCKTLDTFDALTKQHESLISKITKQDTVKDALFKDFNGSVKSLGAWGGDFVLVTAKEHPENYFKNKGFETIISYEDMVLKF
ncbi:GYDIA family GHMP kinase [Thalassobellus sediminis]|uniref:GYDIA family GHMP kinase n=1 Tax=Thalassobellus sediminis TaxID=3367753 RepID=UPI003793E796